MDAPLARALLGKRLDDEVKVATPRGDRAWVIVGIEYQTARGSDAARGGDVTSPARS